MKNWVIKTVKRHPILYRGAKKIYRTINPANPTIYRNYDYQIAYELEDEREIKKILYHYNSFRKYNMQLFILVKGNISYIHEYIRKYPGITFLSLDYYRKYGKKMDLTNIILVDAQKEVPDIINYI